jgi:ribosomal protein S16
MTTSKHRIELVCSASVFARTDDAIPDENASYCIVVVDRNSRRDRRYIETIGFYDPTTQPTRIEVNEERARYWLSVGARPNRLVAGILDGFIKTDTGIVADSDAARQQGDFRAAI